MTHTKHAGVNPELDFTSESFDPVKALYEPRLSAPLPVRPLTSLASCRILLPPNHPDYLKRTTAAAPVKTEPQKPKTPQKIDLLDQMAGWFVIFVSKFSSRQTGAEGRASGQAQ